MHAKEKLGEKFLPTPYNIEDHKDKSAAKHKSSKNTHFTSYLSRMNNSG